MLIFIYVYEVKTCKLMLRYKTREPTSKKAFYCLTIHSFMDYDNINITPDFFFHMYLCNCVQYWLLKTYIFFF